MLIKYFIVSMCQLFILVQLVHKNHSARHLRHNMLSLLLGPSMAHYTGKMCQKVSVTLQKLQNIKIWSLWVLRFSHWCSWVFCNIMQHQIPHEWYPQHKVSKQHTVKSLHGKFHWHNFKMLRTWHFLGWTEEKHANYQWG